MEDTVVVDKTIENVKVEEPKSTEQIAVPDSLGVIDRFINKFLSKKLFVIILGTVLFCLGKLTPELWVGMTAVYIGVQGAHDMLQTWTSRASNVVDNSEGNG